MTICAVVDTSSLVPFELRRSLQEAAQLRIFTAIWSPWIIAELNRVLVWRWIKDPPQGLTCDDLSRANERRCGAAAKQMMERLLASFELVRPAPALSSRMGNADRRVGLPNLGNGESEQRPIRHFREHASLPTATA